MRPSQENSLNTATEFGTHSLAEAQTPAAIIAAAQSGEYRILRHNGAVVAFEPSEIAIAVTKAFLAVNGGQSAASARVRELVEQLTASVVAALMRRRRCRRCRRPGLHDAPWRCRL